MENPQGESSISIREAYEQRLCEYREIINGHLLNKHTFISSALCGAVNNEVLEGFYERCATKDGDCDFCMVGLIRVMYLSRTATGLDETARSELDRVVRRCEDAFAAFEDKFWPHKGRPFPDSIVFWSENHILMLLTSSFLYKQWNFQKTEASRPAGAARMPYVPLTPEHELELKLLRENLRAHAMHGMFEVLSHVYLPHTLAALFNLVDFAEDQEIQDNAFVVIDKIVQQLLLCTTDKGVANLAASCRAFARTRQRTHGHNVNQLIRLLVGQNPDEFGPSALTDFLLTTRWRPNESLLDDFRTFSFLKKKMNPTLAELEEHVFNEAVCGIPARELTPFFWSAGLVSHPDFARRTKEYLKEKKMEHNVHLWPLQFLSKGMAESLMNSYKEVSSGQVYAGVVLNVYKQPGGLCLSSFDHFNLGSCSFQQQPWMANIDGVGVWTESGGGNDSMVGFGMSNTTNPAISQVDGLLVAAYNAPPGLRSCLSLGSVFSSQVRLFWPVDAFDEEYRETAEDVKQRGQKAWAKVRTVTGVLGGMFGMERSAKTVPKNSWWVGRRGECFIGVFCSRETKTETGATKEATYESARGVRHVFTRRICMAHESNWVVRVSTTAEFPTLSEFYAYCANCISVEGRVCNKSDVGAATALPSHSFFNNSSSSSSTTSPEGVGDIKRVVVAVRRLRDGGASAGAGASSTTRVLTSSAASPQQHAASNSSSGATDGDGEDSIEAVVVADVPHYG